MKRLFTLFALVAMLTLSAGSALANTPTNDHHDCATPTPVTDGLTADHHKDCPTPPPTEQPTPPPTEEPTPPPTEEPTPPPVCEWNSDIPADSEDCVPPPTPTPAPVQPTFVVSCGLVTVAGITDGWQFIVEPGDLLLVNGKNPLAPGDYTYNLRYNGQDGIGDSGKFSIVACPMPTPTVKPTATPAPTEEPTVPATDTVGSTGTGGTGGYLPLLGLLAFASVGSLLLTAKRR
jgi:hypothetical protein